MRLPTLEKGRGEGARGGDLVLLGSKAIPAFSSFVGTRGSQQAWTLVQG